MYTLATLLIPPLLTAFLAAVGVWLRDSRERRDQDKERSRVLTQVQEEISVIASWIAAYELVSSGSEEQEKAKARAKGDLDLAYSRLEETLAASRGLEGRITFKQLAQTMLLVGRLDTGVGKFLQVMYYAALIWAALWAAVGTSVTLSSQITFENVTLAVVMIVVVGVLPALGFYHLAIRADRWRARKLNSLGMARHVASGSSPSLL
jgi:hypothetical protein